MFFCFMSKDIKQRAVGNLLPDIFPNWRHTTRSGTHTLTLLIFLFYMIKLKYSRLKPIRQKKYGMECVRIRFCFFFHKMKAPPFTYLHTNIDRGLYIQHMKYFDIKYFIW